MSFTRRAAVAFSAAILFALALPKGVAGDEPAGDKPTYVGNKACQKCHFQEHKSWKKTPMAKAMQALVPTTEADNKELFDKKTAAKLDPAKDYSTDEKCLKCHTTGYGEEGGYPKDAKADEKAAALMGSVSCESCHGPGSLYVKYKTAEVEKNKEVKFKWEELAKYGLTKPDEAVCAKCHNDQNPTMPSTPFKFDEAKEKVHEHPKK